MPGIERVEVMVMIRRLFWLSHLEWLDDTSLLRCLLVCCQVERKCSVGGHKMRGCDVIMRELKNCYLIPDWHDVVCERAV